MTLRQRYLVLIAVFLGMLPAALDQTIVDTALPHMLADLGGVTLWGWVGAVFLITSTAPVPVMGRLIDLYGRKRFFIIAVALFIGASVLCATATSMPLLILYRGIQGLGAGVIFPLGTIIIGDLLPQEQRARVMGLYVGAFGLATVIGPQVGGLLVDIAGWRSIFYMNVPLGILSLILVTRNLHETIARKRVPIDLAGAVLITAGFALLLLALQQGGTAWAWDSWQSLVMLGAGALSLIAFVLVERRTPVPIFDLSLFRDTTFTTLCVMAFLAGAVVTSTALFIPWFLQGVIGVSASAAGGALSPMMLMLLIAAAISSTLTRHMTYRSQFIGGFALLAGALLLMTQFSITTSWLYTALTTGVAGAGAGLILPLLNVTVQNAFPPDRRSVVIATTSFARAVGSAAGLTLFLATFNSRMAAQFEPAIGPLLRDLPTPLAAGIRATFAEHPLDLIQVLVNQQATAALPPAVQAPLAGVVREMFISSAYQVYLLGIGGCLLGALIATLLGRASMTTAYRPEPEPEPESALI